MLPSSVALSLLLAPAAPSPNTWQEYEAECRRLEDAIKSPGSGPLFVAAADACGRAFEAVPGGRNAMDQRSYFAFEAHRLYQRAHEAGSKEALCADAEVLATFAAQLAGLKPGARARDRRDVAMVSEQVQAQLTTPCLDDTAGNAARPDEPVFAADRAVASNAAPAPVAAVLTPPPDAERIDVAPTVAPTVAPERARRPLRIVGGAAIGLGLGFGVGIIGVLAHGAALRGRADVTNGNYAGQLIPGSDAGRFDTDKARGERADSAAIGLGVAGGLLAVVGVALVVVDARRGRPPRRVSVTSSILPTAGIRLTLEF